MDATPVVRRRAATNRPLGPISLLVLRAVERLPPKKRYLSQIEYRISEQLGGHVEVAQVFVTLRRLQANHMVKPRSGPAPSGLKHTVTFYSITTSGRKAIISSRDFYRLVCLAADA